MHDKTALWAAYAADRSIDNRNALVVAYVPLAESVARVAYARHAFHVEFCELLSGGMTGLIDCVERYDPDKGCQFEGFAGKRIAGAILDWLREVDHLSRWTRAKVTAGVVKVPETFSLTRKPKASYDGNESETFGWDFVDPAAGNPEKAAIDKEMVAAVMRPLDARTRQVVQWYDLDGLTMVEIGRRMGLSASRISQSRTGAIEFLRGRAR